MLTYLVIDLTTKKHYVGSTSSLNTGRPWGHLDGNSHNSKVAEASRNGQCFVFVSEDDGLDTRDEEQFYLDFYFGSKWCFNVSPNASGLPPRRMINECRVKNGTHNFLQENRNEASEKRRVVKVIEALHKRNFEMLANGTHPFLQPHIQAKAIEAWKKASKQHRRFGQKSKTPAETSRKMSQAGKRNNGPAQSAMRVRAQRVSVLSRKGFEGLFPPSCEFSSSLSSDFIHYFSYYGKWQ